MKRERLTFALFFGNRGFFPASFIKEARTEISERLRTLGYDSIMLDEHLTRHGAVETVKEGKIYADFLKAHKGKYDGVILSLPNFGDENGAAAALKEADVPIFVQAYPDTLDKMAPAFRRDSFCGKFSILDVFKQNSIPFTIQKPHTVHPKSEAFAHNIDHFARLCNVVRHMNHMVVGAIGARTTAFKTVRIDELALQKYGITVETLDLSDIFQRVRAKKDSDADVLKKLQALESYTTWPGVPKSALMNFAKLGTVYDDVIAEYEMDAVAIRCWMELEKELGIAPCVLLSEMNERGVVAACEVDVGNAVMMYALSKASWSPATVLDWNNNYGEEEDKCILFHCGPTPRSMMSAAGKVTDHPMLATSLGPGCSYGPNQGRMIPGPITYGSLLTEDGEVKLFLGEGEFTADPIPEDFFGCAGVAQIQDLQDVLLAIGYMGHRHHVSVTPGHVLAPLSEALYKYIGFEVTSFQG